MVEVLQVLRALHILAAIAWGGGAVYSNAVIQAAARKSQVGPQLEAAFFATGRHSRFMAITSVTTILFGGALMGIGEYGLDAIGFGAMVMGMSMTFALVAFGVGAFGHTPTEARLRPLANKFLDGGLEAAQQSEYRVLLARNHTLSRVSMALIGLAMFGMLTFRMFA